MSVSDALALEARPDRPWASPSHLRHPNGTLLTVCGRLVAPFARATVEAWDATR